MLYRNSVPKRITNEDAEGQHGFVTLVCFFIAAACFFGFICVAFNYLMDKRYVSQAVSTQGRLIERIKIVKDRSNPEFYLRYTYINPTTNANCDINFDTRTTPTDRACYMNVSRIQVSHAKYKSADIPSSTRILFIPNKDTGWSKAVDYARPASYYKFVMGLLLGLSFCLFTLFVRLFNLL